ncbi:MAG: thioesterase family protein [Rhodocyclaceae bacterium]
MTLRRDTAAETSHEAELLGAIHEIFSAKIPFNRVLGLEIVSLQNARPVLRFAMREELVGNFLRGMLHGGVISSTLDVTGGLVAFLGAAQRFRHEALEARIARFERISTIDMRIDYLRPGLGAWFEASGYALRTGNKVAVTRMELRNDSGELVAVGTGAYTVS